MNQEIRVESLKVIGNRVLIIPEETSEMKTRGGIILTETYDSLKREVIGQVVGVGEKLSDQIQVGDKICYQKVYELTVFIKDVRHVVLRGEHIIAYSRD